MPIYEYHCNECTHQFEVLQKVSDTPVSKCPKCEHYDVQKLVSATSFRLKGSGWYETDFKSKPTEKATTTVPLEKSEKKVAQKTKPPVKDSAK